MAPTITNYEHQREVRIAEARMLISRLVHEKCGDLTLAEYLAVLIDLASSINREILKEESEEA